MKYYLLIIITSFCSCMKNEVVAQEVITNNVIDEQKLDDKIQEIGSLYKPEKMVLKENSVESNHEKEDYQITLTNSDLLDNSSTVELEKHALNIANSYYKYLKARINPLNVKKVIVKIEHRNKQADRLEYLEENFNYSRK